MSAVNSKKTYLVWLDALTEDQLTIVAAIEKYFAREQGIDAPKGLKEWKTFVTAVVDMYERTLSTLAEVAEEEAAAMAVADAEREKTEFVKEGVTRMGIGALVADLKLADPDDFNLRRGIRLELSRAMGLSRPGWSALWASRLYNPHDLNGRLSWMVVLDDDIKFITGWSRAQWVNRNNSGMSAAIERLWSS